MSFWSKSSTAAIFGALNSVLLLVLVVQNAVMMSDTPSSSNMPQAMMNPHASGFHGSSMDPSWQDNTSAPRMPSAPILGDDGEFDPKAMIYASMNCPDNPSVTLGDPGCSGNTANQRKQFVIDTVARGLPLRDTFDAIVGQFGDGSLTEQARAIRNARLAR